MKNTKNKTEFNSRVIIYLLRFNITQNVGKNTKVYTS